MQSPRLVHFIFLPVLYYLGSKLGTTYTVMPEGIVILWLPNAVLLAALIRFDGRGYPYFVGLAIAAEIVSDIPLFTLLEAALFGVVNVLEASLAYWLLKRWRFNPRLAAPADLSKFIAAGPVIAALTAAVFGALIYSVFRGTETSYLEFLRIWWFGDGLGLMILTPLLLSVWPYSVIEDQQRAAPRFYDGLAALAAVAAFGAFFFSYRGELFGVGIGPMLLLPFVLYAAARLGLRGAAVVVAVVAFAVLSMLTGGRQPFGDLPPRASVIQAQEFIFIMSLMSLGFAALLSQLRATQRDLERRVRERTAELTALNEQLEKLVVTDPLTGVFNRRALFELLEREIKRAKRHNRRLAVIMFDIDHFKSINDRYGHAVGDMVLRRVSERIGAMIRGSDSLARYGGEEFAVVAPETGRDHAVQLAERMCAALRAMKIEVNQEVLGVTASFGVALLRRSDQQPEELLQRADESLYAAKAGGRNRVVA